MRRPPRVPVFSLDEGTVTLPRDASHYLCRVLRLAAGDELVAFDPEEHIEADGVIVRADPDGAEVRLAAVRRAAVLARSPLVLIQALAKSDKIDNIVRDATELGATRIILAKTALSVVKLADNVVAGKVARWQRIGEQAARQCGRADPPILEDILTWTEALEKVRTLDARFCLDPRAAEPLGARLGELTSSGASIALAVGPEGGLTPDELEEARVRGFALVSVGHFVLRTETVATAVLGAVRVLAPP